MIVVLGVYLFIALTITVILNLIFKLTREIDNPDAHKRILFLAITWPISWVLFVILTLHGLFNRED